MKKLLFLLFVSINSFGQFSLGVISSSQRFVPSKENIIPPIDVDVQLGLIKAFFNRAYIARDGYLDRAATIPIIDGGDILCVKESIQGTKKMLFTTATPTDPLVNAGISGQTSTFPVPGQGTNGTYLTFYSENNGFIHFYNGFNKNMSMAAESDVAQPLEFWIVARVYQTIIQEQFCGGFQSLTYKLGNTYDGITGWSSGPFLNLAPGKGRVNYLETAVFTFVVTGNTIQVFISDSRGDLVDQGTVTMTGTNFLRNWEIGSNGHPQNLDYFSSFIKFGNSTSPDRTVILDLLKTVYPIGQKPSKPHCIPTIAYNSGTGNWNVTLNYNAGVTGYPIDLSATVVNWYHGDQLNSVTGNMLDKQSLFTTTDGNTLFLHRASWPTQFPGVSNSTNYINVGVTVFDTHGNSWREVCAIPDQD